MNIKKGKWVDPKLFATPDMDGFYHRRHRAFRDNQDQERKFCPVCGSTDHRTVFEPYGAQYVQCQTCTHVYLKYLPNMSYEDLYDDGEYGEMYRKNAKFRYEQVAVPKAKWVGECLEDNFINPHVLKAQDYGCGGGQFMGALKEEVQVDFVCGVEIDSKAQSYCRAKGLPVQLVSKENMDLNTYWGFLEHVDQPDLYFNNGYALAGAVPNWNSRSTKAQMIKSVDGIQPTRHADPLYHWHLFTKTSLIRLMEENGYKVTHLWYFGMDAWEIGIRSKFWFNVYQRMIDAECESDEIGFFAIRK